MYLLSVPNSLQCKDTQVRHSLPPHLVPIPPFLFLPYSSCILNCLLATTTNETSKAQQQNHITAFMCLLTYLLSHLLRVRAANASFCACNAGTFFGLTWRVARNRSPALKRTPQQFRMHPAGRLYSKGSNNPPQVLLDPNLGLSATLLCLWTMTALGTTF